MKPLLSLLILFSFLYRPTYEISNILYYTLNRDYVVETYCVNKAKPEMHCNGKCFLNTQLHKLDNPYKSKSSGITLSKTFIPAFFERVSYPNIEGIEFIYKVDNWGRPILNSSNIIKELEHPPNV